MSQAATSLGYPGVMRRIERLINLIAALLESPRPMTADEIRHRISGYGDERSDQAFRRAFERDKETLRDMGIPLEVVKTDAFTAQADAYTISKSRYYLPQLDLEPDELAALQLAAETVLGAGEDAGSGLLKLSVESASAPPSGPRLVWGADVAAEQPLLGPLYAAVLERTPVAFDYGAASGHTARRTVEPYGLVHRRGHWYVVGRDRQRQAIRSFKLSRISSAVERLEGTYEIPESFDAAEHVRGEGGGAADKGRAVVRFDAEMRWWASQNLGHLRAREAPDGALDVELALAGVERLVAWVLEFGPHVEILSPPEARRRLVDHLAPYLGEAASA